MSVKDWFHDTLGKFTGDEGGGILEIYLLRREMALGQLRLLRKRRQLCGGEPLSLGAILKQRGKSKRNGKISAGSKVRKPPSQSAA